MKVKDLDGKGVLVRFGPLSDPERFQIDLLEVARQKSLFKLKDINELELEIGDRLGERPYPNTGRTMMPPTYLCEGSVWVNFCTDDGRYANVSLVPHLDRSGHRDSVPVHHNLYIYWTDFAGKPYCDKQIPGHVISKDEPIVITIICGKEIRKGTIDVKS